MFFGFAPIEKVEKTRFERNWATFVNPAFCTAWKSPPKMVVWNRLCGTRSQGCFFVSPRWGKSSKGVLVGGLFQAAQKAGLTKIVQLRWKCVFSTFPIGAKRKSTLGIEFYEVAFIPPFWVAFSKLRKKPGWRRSSNCVENVFFRLSPSGETKKNPWDRTPRGRFHAYSLGWFFQAAQNAVLTKVVQLRWKRVFSTLPIGAKRKSTLGIEFYEVGFIPPFWVGFSKQRKKPGWRRSSNCVVNAFFRLSPSARNEKTPLGSNSTRSVSCLHFGLLFPSSAKSRVDEHRPIALKTRFFLFPHRSETENHHWDRILRGRIYTSILNWFFQAAQKAALTNVVQLRWKRVFSTFPIGAKRKKTLGIEFHEVSFIPPFWVGFSKQRKKPVWRRSSNCVENAFFRLSQSGRNEKNTLGIEFNEVGFIPPFWVGSSKKRKKPGGWRSSNCVENAFLRLSQLRRNEKTPLGSNSTRLVSYHHFGLDFPRSEKSQIDEGHPIALKTRFFDFPHRDETKKHTWDRIPRGRFHTTIFGGLFQAAQKAELTNIVKLSSKRVFGLSPSGRNEKTPFGSNSTRSVSYHHFGWAFLSSAESRIDENRKIEFETHFSTFPIGAKRKNTVWIELHEVGFMPPFWVGFSKQRKKLNWRISSNWVQNAFFDFPHRGETKKKHRWDRIRRRLFHTTILGGLFQAVQKAELTNIVKLNSKRVFRLSPSGRNE